VYCCCSAVRLPVQVHPEAARQLVLCFFHMCLCLALFSRPGLSRRACLVVWSGALLEACGWPDVGMHVCQHSLAAFWDAAWSPLLRQRPHCITGRPLPSPHASPHSGRHMSAPYLQLCGCVPQAHLPRCQSDLLHFLFLFTGPTSIC
jgi:hypothetical protein